MLALHQITHRAGTKLLYEKASLQVGPKDRIGIVGLNGVGKTTLFKIITGRVSVDEGRIEQSKGVKIGYLEQDHLSYRPEQSILSVAMEAFQEVVKLEAQIEKILDQMATDYEVGLAERLASYQEQFKRLDGYKKQAHAKQVLQGLGFQPDQLDSPIATLSGGWRMRVLLSRLILRAPDLLLLDEPTNHLDIDSIGWLERYLSTYPHALMVISHDKTFLEKTTNKSLEIRSGRFQLYAGNYTYYVKERVKQDLIQKRAYLNQQKKIAETERFIQRFRAQASKAKLVQSKIKALDRLERIAPPLGEQAKVQMRFGSIPKSGKKILSLEQIEHAYGEKILFLGADAEITRGEKIALIGANGQGKTTLLKIIASKVAPQGGRVRLGQGVKTGFYAQDQWRALDLNNTILEELISVNETHSIEALRQILGSFLFQKEAVNKKIRLLSGGERARVALAKGMIQAPNFFILDEPTNHLDMPTTALLAEALKQYPGTLLFVSHNRDFIQKVATTIWRIDQGEIKIYPGDYERFVSSPFYHLSKA